MLRRLLILLIAAFAVFFWKPGWFRASDTKPAATASRSDGVKHYVEDRAGVIASGDLPRFDQYMAGIMRESGVDVRFVFLPGTGDKSIEMLAVDLMDELKIGGRTGQERGVLLVYDVQGKRLKVEVGYGLEGWFPDAFVSYLVEDHTRMFFSSGDLSLGLRLLLRLLQNRIREAVIGNDFDPRTLAKVQPLTHMSGGAGVSKSVGLRDGARPAPAAAPVDPLAFPAGNSPTDTYQHYMDWLAHWPLSPNADLFTPESRAYLASLNFSPAYAEFILLGESGKRFQIVERGDLALLYFTSTPFVSPHFLVRQEGRWRVDIVAEVRNTREQVGSEYTWAWRGEGDSYNRAFEDLLTTVKGHRRIRNGDNRALVIRGSI